jgi:inner membrane protein
MNGPTHRLVAGAAVGFYLANQEAKAGPPTLRPFAGGVAAVFFTNLPDILEPATSPNHRGFFHSLAFVGLLATGVHKLHQWQPEGESDKFWRCVGMLAGSAYLIHLVLDFTTRKSLPVLGRI